MQQHYDTCDFACFTQLRAELIISAFVEQMIIFCHLQSISKLAIQTHN